MPSFLSQVAEDILNRYELPREQIHLLFPNYRAALFLQKELARQSDQPIWSPGLLTMDQLVEEHTEPLRADDLTLVYQLYKSWQEVIDTDREESFNRFFFWGKSLLNDFDEVDKYRVDPKELFHHIRDLHALEARFDSTDLLKELSPVWESLLKDYSRTKQAFLHIWNNLYAVYTNFQNRLREEHIACGGMLYRSLADQPEALDDFCEHSVMVIGFNRLSSSEQTILRYLEDHGDVRFYWDDDDYITDELGNDAGRFIKEGMRQFPPAVDSGSRMREENKDITIRGIPLLAGQAQWVREQLTDWQAGEETAVIIPDERLLIPVLSAWPKEVDELNISMGLPIRETPVLTLVEAFISLHDSFRQNDERYYYRWIDALINHPYLPDAAELLNEGLQKEEGTNWSNRKKKIYCRPEELPRPDELFDILFEPLEQSGDFFERIVRLLQYAYQKFAEAESDDHMAREMIYYSHSRMMRLRDIVRESEMDLPLESILPLIEELFRLTRIPFKGEPLQGTQILGPLETRSLDFDRLIIPGMNEGTFPPQSRESFIPFGIRKAFGLPTTDDYVAEYSYYFWAALQRAGEVVLLYNTETGDMGQQERSRFIQQLLYLPNNWTIHIEAATPSFMPEEISNFHIEQTAPVSAAIEQYLKEGISPSALNTYLNCRLRFYLEYILKWREQDDITEVIDAAVVGQIVHRVMELLYNSKNEVLSKSSIRRLKMDMAEAIDKAMEELLDLPEVMLHRGLAPVYRDIIIQYVTGILEYDMDQAPLKIHEHEKKLENSPIPRAENGEDRIGITGYIDRIDEYQDTVRVIDYKTGDVSVNFSSVEDLFDREKAPDKRNGAALQTILYAIALSQDARFEGRSIEPALYNVRNILEERKESKVHNLTMGKAPFQLRDIRRSVVSRFYEIMDEMGNPDQPFDQTDDSDRCKHCPFIHFCGREEALK